METLSLEDWDLLLRQAKSSNLISKLATLAEQYALLNKIPEQAKEHLLWAQNTLERHHNAVLWEVQKICEALQQTNTPITLLKGAAYVLAKLPTAHGRVFSDIDILVPKKKLSEVESALMIHGWHTAKMDAYDQRYYRTWMHELPPMTHIQRGTSIDVHHAILPETAYVHPDSEKLLTAAMPIHGYQNLKVLAPIDMFLHSAAHLFHEGELDKGLRDLSDLDSLIKHLGQHADFWANLNNRAIELELTRPLFYALRYTAKILNTTIPEEVVQQAQIGSPNPLLLKLMDFLFLRALLPKHSSCSDHFSHIAHFLLFIRGNWLRMPPLLLAQHLFHKAFLSPKKD